MAQSGGRLRHEIRRLAPSLLILALGIAAASSALALLDPLLVRPLPFPRAQELLYLKTVQVGRGDLGVASWPDFDDWRRQQRTLAGVAAFNIALRSFGGGAPEQLHGAVVSPEFFSVLRVAPRWGRVFEAEPSAGSREVIISDRLWRHRLGGDRGALGRKLLLDGQAFTLVGVMGEDFRHPEPRWEEPADFWLPLARDSERGSRYLRVIARLAPGVGIAAAQAAMDGLSRELARRYRADEGTRVELVPLREYVVGQLRPRLLLLGALATLFLAMVTINLAFLELSRATIRLRELGIRLALGATRRRLMGRSLVQSLLLAILGGAAGLVLASWAAAGLSALLPPAVAHFLRPAVDARVALLGLLLAFTVTAAVGAIPALVAGQVDPVSVLGAEERMSPGRGTGRVFRAIVIAEVALLLPVLVFTILAALGYAALVATPAGFRTEGVWTCRLALSLTRYDDAGARMAFFSRLEDGARELPGVGAAALSLTLPLSSFNDAQVGVVAEGHALPAESELPQAHPRVVSAGYFRALGIPLVEGRPFGPEDRVDGQRVAIVSRGLAQALWPERPAVGQRLKVVRSPRPWATVVGIAGDTREERLDAPPTPELYFYLPQAPIRDVAVAVLTKGRADDLPPALRALVAKLDPELPIMHAESLADLVAEATAEPRLETELLAGLAGAAAILTGIGIFGVMSVSLALRRRELAIRQVLGASRPKLLGLVLRAAFLPAAGGLAAGLGLTWYLARSGGQLPLSLGTWSAAVLIGNVAFVVLIVAAACLSPMRAAVGIHPAAILRGDGRGQG